MTACNSALWIAQYEDKDFTLYAYDVPLDETSKEEEWERMDLDGAIGVFQVKDETGTIVFTKTSSIASQIEIAPDQVTAATKGTAILKIVGADTSTMTPGATYYYDFWVYTNTGKWRRIIKKARFHVEDGIYEPSVGAPADDPADPASQTPQFRSFEFVTPTAGDDFVVTIPGAGMVSANYSVGVCITGDSWVGVKCPVSGSNRTTTTFRLLLSGPVLAGATFDFTLRDRS